MTTPIDLSDFRRLTDGTVMKRILVDDLIYWIPINKAEKDPDDVEEPEEDDGQTQVDEDNLYERDGISHRTGGRWPHKVEKHMGPGPHPSGSPQSTHAGTRRFEHAPSSTSPYTYDIIPLAREAVALWHEEHGTTPPDLDWANLKQSHDFQVRVAHAYDGAPEYDNAAEASYDQFALEIEEQYAFLTETMGLRAEVIAVDPYRNVKELVRDVDTNNRLRVMATATTGPHPYLTDEQNDKFRMVHDFFGHIATGRDFDRHGEEAAYLHHAAMFSDLARPAMASETRGQNASLIVNGDFPPQKVVLLPGWAYNTMVEKTRADNTRAREGFTAEIHIAKSFKNQVFGWANVSIRKDGTQIEDHQSHRIDTEDLEDAAYDFVLNSYGSGDMHLSSGKGQLIESMVFTKEKMVNLGIPPNSIPEGWWVGFKLDPAHAEMVRSGKRTMFSIEGSARLEPV